MYPECEVRRPLPSVPTVGSNVARGSGDAPILGVTMLRRRGPHTRHGSRLFWSQDGASIMRRPPTSPLRRRNRLENERLREDLVVVTVGTIRHAATSVRVRADPRAELGRTPLGGARKSTWRRAVGPAPTHRSVVECLLPRAWQFGASRTQLELAPRTFEDAWCRTRRCWLEGPAPWAIATLRATHR